MKTMNVFDVESIVRDYLCNQANKEDVEQEARYLIQKTLESLKIRKEKESKIK